MKNTKIISVVLSFCLFFSLLLPGVSAYAAGGNLGTGLELKKTVTPNDNGTYKVTLETYATGASIITEVTEDVPTDIILVLDTSGSMDKQIGSVSFTKYESNQSANSQHYNRRHNGGSANLWYKLDDGSYVSVSVTKTTEYTELSTNPTNSTYYNNRNNLYEKVGEEYKKVTLIREYIGWYDYEYTYTFFDGSTVKSSGGSTRPNLGTHTPLYTAAADGNNTVYTYTYTDANGTPHTIGTSTGANTQFGTKLYQRNVNTNAGGTRMAALKSAANAFANSVAAKAKGADGQYGGGDDIDHRIAIVEFTDNAWDRTNGLVDMTTANGLTTVTNAVNGLSAGGNTAPATGINTANTIFSRNPIASGEKRNRVIVLFTDGYPAERGTDNINYGWCDQAIAAANTSKNTYGATVYTVGIFSGANPSDDIESNFVYGDRDEDNINTTQLVAANRYMHYTSSNYPNAQSLRIGGAKTGSGYYLSASDAAALNSIFQQISSQIESGGTTTTLTGDAVIKDIIAPSFKLPDNAQPSDIELYLSEYTGENQWAVRTPAPSGITASISGDQVNVTGYDFHDLWCGTETTNGTTTYRGQKLIIEFNIEVKPEFLGGNQVPTNGADSGVYENMYSDKAIDNFKVPVTDVELKEFLLKTPDKNVYENDNYIGLLGNELEISTDGGTNWVSFQTWYDGLEDWMKAYVKNIETKPDETTGKYTVSFDLDPSLTGSVEKKTFSATANLNVFTPVLTFEDKTVDYGATVNEAFFNNNNYLSSKTVWKCGDKLSTGAGVTMTGTEPTVSLTYVPSSVETPQAGGDIPVAVTVKTNDKTSAATFAWQKDNDCLDGETDPNPNAQFRIHCRPGVVNLVLSKTVTGNLGDYQKQFSFSVEYKDVNGQRQTATVELKHLDSETIKIQYGSDVKITEEDAEDYETSYTVNGVTTAEGRECTLSKITGATTVSFTNDKDENVDAGITLDSIPYILIIVGVVAAGAVMVIKKRRNAYDD